MSLLRSLFEQRHDPAPVTGQLLLDMLHKGKKTSSGQKVTEKNAITLTSVFRAASLISGTVAGLPLKTYRSIPGHPERGAESGRVETHVRVISSPNPTMTDFEYRERQTAHLALWGNSYSLKVRDGSSRIIELWPILPDYVTPKLVDGEKKFVIDPPNGDRIITDSTEIFHIPGFGYDGVAGLSPIGMAREAIGNAMAEEKYAGSVYSNGAMIGGIITTPRRLNREQALGIKQRWKDTVGGVENAHDIGILDQGMEFKQLTMKPTDLEFIETRKFSVEEIARLYGVPPHLLGDVDRSTSWGTGIEEQTIGFVTFTIKPGYLQRIERRYTLEILSSGQFAEFKVDGLLRGSSKVRADIYEKALDPATGWMTVDEVRSLENLPHLDVFDEREEEEEEPEPAPDTEPEEDVTEEEQNSFRERAARKAQAIPTREEAPPKEDKIVMIHRIKTQGHIKRGQHGR